MKLVAKFLAQNQCPFNNMEINKWLGLKVVWPLSNYSQKKPGPKKNVVKLSFCPSTINMNCTQSWWQTLLLNSSPLMSQRDVSNDTQPPLGIQLCMKYYTNPAWSLFLCLSLWERKVLFLSGVYRETWACLHNWGLGTASHKSTRREDHNYQLRVICLVIPSFKSYLLDLN